MWDETVSARMQRKVYETVARAEMLFGLEMLSFTLGPTRTDRIRNESIRETGHV